MGKVEKFASWSNIDDNIGIWRYEIAAIVNSVESNSILIVADRASTRTCMLHDLIDSIKPASMNQFNLKYDDIWHLDERRA